MGSAFDGSRYLTVAEPIPSNLFEIRGVSKRIWRLREPFRLNSGFRPVTPPFAIGEPPVGRFAALLFPAPCHGRTNGWRPTAEPGTNSQLAMTRESDLPRSDCGTVLREWTVDTRSYRVVWSTDPFETATSSMGPPAPRRSAPATVASHLQAGSGGDHQRVGVLGSNVTPYDGEFHGRWLRTPVETVSLRSVSGCTDTPGSCDHFRLLRRRIRSRSSHTSDTE